MMRAVVSDTGPLLSVFQSEQLDVLRHHYPEAEAMILVAQPD